MRRALAVLVVLGLATVACGREGPLVARDRDSRLRAPGAVEATPASLVRFEGCEPLLDHLKTEATERVTDHGLTPSYGSRLLRQALPMTAEDGSGGAAAESAPAGVEAFSTTNVQEQGVDEPDLVKTDGRRLFTLAYSRQRVERDMRLVSLSLEGGRPQKLGELEVPQVYASELLLARDRVLLMGTSMSGGPAWLDGREPAAVPDIAPVDYRPQTTILVVDVSDPTSMRIIQTIRLDGSYLSARMVDGVARVVLAAPQRMPLPEPMEADPEAIAERSRRAIAASSIEDWLPRYEIVDGDGGVSDDGALASCDSTYRPPHFSGFEMLSVVTIDPANPEPHSSATVLGAGGTVYASARSLYVATQRYEEVFPLAVPDVVAEPSDDPDTPTEPLIRPGREHMPVPDPIRTQIHRFDISGPQAAYLASGEVAGTVLNQWSMSEHEGLLRVATTEQAFRPDWSSDSSSSVTVLATRGSDLIEIGKIDGLGPDERIYGVRFMGETAYVVTFREIDPFHVIDLADPTNPRLMGELKIPGYSSYLHPVGPGRVLGVGQDVSLEGVPLGLQLSLFDVSDPSDPRRIAQIRIDHSYTPVEHDHRAFTWWEPTAMAVVPVVSSPQGFFDEIPQGYAAAFRVTSSDVREMGRIEHDAPNPENEWSDGNYIQRSLVVGDTLFTVSRDGVMSSELGSFARTGWVAF